MIHNFRRLTSGTEIPGRHRLRVDSHQRATRLGDQLDLAAQWAVTAGVAILVAALIGAAAVYSISEIGQTLQAVFPR